MSLAGQAQIDQTKQVVELNCYTNTEIFQPRAKKGPFPRMYFNKTQCPRKAKELLLYHRNAVFRKIYTPITSLL